MDKCPRCGGKLAYWEEIDRLKDRLRVVLQSALVWCNDEKECQQLAEISLEVFGQEGK
jgi:hypothetical protein